MKKDLNGMDNVNDQAIKILGPSVPCEVLESLKFPHQQFVDSNKTLRLMQCNSFDLREASKQFLKCDDNLHVLQVL